MKFKGISELTHELNALMVLEKQSKLTLEQLEDAYQMAREISERLIVLRHKAYEKFIRPENSDQRELDNDGAQPSEQNVIQNSLIEDGQEVVTPYFQMSLIDAIEEASVNTDQNEVVESEELLLENAIELMNDAVNVEIESLVGEETQVINTDDNKVEDEISEESIPTLNSSLAQQMPQAVSLADKHQFDKIDDLKRAITLNQRFQFSRELFKGNNQEYEVAIDRLNNSTREEALLMLRDLRAKFDWQEESSAALDFYGLVERRYSPL